MFQARPHAERHVLEQTQTVRANVRLDCFKTVADFAMANQAEFRALDKVAESELHRYQR
jgi:hypothetical protein